MLEMTHPPKTTLITADEFWVFVEALEDKTRGFELIDGEIIEMPSGSSLHTYIISFLITALFSFARSNKIGYAFADGCTYQLTDKLILIPDVSYTSTARLNPPFVKRFKFSPDLAVEVISSSNTHREILKKIEAYLAHGTKLVWIVFPEDKVVDVWRAMPDGSLNKRTFGMTDTLSGEAVLPNFTLPISHIF